MKRWQPNPVREDSPDIRIPQRLDEEVACDPTTIYAISITIS
jgi:hypothetical protein